MGDAKIKQSTIRMKKWPGAQKKEKGPAMHSTRLIGRG